MRHDLQTVLARRAADCRHMIKFCPQLLIGLRNMLKPVCQIVGRIKSADIEIPGPLPEPSTHLHQCVVHSGGTEEVAD
jgi:hypothetical protein